MTQIERSQMKTTTVITILIAVVSSLTTGFSAYYGNKQGFKDALHEIKIDLIERTDKLDAKNDSKNAVQDRDISELGKRQDKLEEAAMTYISKTPNKYQ